MSRINKTGKISPLQYILAASFCMLILNTQVEAQNLVNVINDHSELSSFAEALEESGLTDELNQSGPYTVFAPSNDAFSQNTSTISSSQLETMLLNHVITGMATQKNIQMMTNAPSMGGLQLQFESSGSEFSVNGANVIQANIKADNGVVHIIDDVLQ